MNVLLWLASAAAAFVAMELWAALLHRRVWHGLLWPVHRTHHVSDDAPRGAPARTWQGNDVLSIVHAPAAVALVVYGAAAAPSGWRELAFGFGLGMTAFGLAYVVVHDGLTHERLPVAGLARWRYLARVRAAHIVHHRGRDRTPFGLFFGPWVLRHEAARRRAHEAKSSRAMPASQRPARTGPSPRNASA